jgi:hypothetical protein
MENREFLPRDDGEQRACVKGETFPGKIGRTHIKMLNLHLK